MTNAKTSSAEPCDKCETEWADEKKRRESWKSAHTPAPKKTDSDRLYDSLDRNNTVKIRVPFDPMLLSTLGYFNPLKEEDRPELADVESHKNLIAAAPELLEFLSDNLKYFAEDSLVQKEAMALVSKAKGE